MSSKTTYFQYHTPSSYITKWKTQIFFPTPVVRNPEMGLVITCKKNVFYK